MCEKIPPGSGAGGLLILESGGLRPRYHSIRGRTTPPIRRDTRLITTNDETTAADRTRRFRTVSVLIAMAFAEVMMRAPNGLLTRSLQTYKLNLIAIAKEIWKNFPQYQDITALQQNYFSNIAVFLKLITKDSAQMPKIRGVPRRFRKRSALVTIETKGGEGFAPLHAGVGRLS